MTIRIKKGRSGKTMRDTIQEMSGVDLGVCYQCKKCSCGCTVSGHSQSPPSEMIRRLQLGAGPELLRNDLIWTCVSCETCFARCPMGIDLVAVMDALRAMAVAQQAPIPEGNIPLFNKAFLKTVALFGRTYDLALMAVYKIGTSSFERDADKIPVIFMKKKIALLPSLSPGRQAVKRIFQKTGQNKGIIR